MMTTKQILDKWLNLGNKIPLESDSYKKWLLYEDILSFFIKKNLNDVIIIYASTSLPSCSLLNSFFVPKFEVDSISEPLIQEILERDFYPHESWMVNYTIPNIKNANIEDYNFSLEEDSRVCFGKSKSISKYESILFRREFQGKHQQKKYVEISQKILHSQGLHYVHERKAFCKFDNFGEIVDGITLHYEEDEKVIAVTARKEVLDQFMAVTNTSLIRIFDITRTPNNFQGFEKERNQISIRDKENKVFSNGFSTLTASYLRGFQVIDCKDSREKALKNIASYDKNEQTEYTTFIANDWRNNKIDELSCDPQKLGNYFVESELPYETSVAFFSKEVLSKYQNDPDKYTINRRGIYCRGGWYLKSHDINNEGQVHAYLIDLAQLPYKEQLYWKSYNEKPKGAISKRAFINDFEGNICDDYDPLHNIKLQLKEMYTESLEWWHNKDESLIDRLHYLATSSEKEWKAALIDLNKLLVDNLNKQYIKKLISDLKVGTKLDNIGSLKTLDCYLKQKGCKEELINNIMSPLYNLNALRTNICAHTQSEGNNLFSEVINNHGSLDSHFKYLIKSCDQSLKELRETLE